MGKVKATLGDKPYAHWTDNAAICFLYSDEYFVTGDEYHEFLDWWLHGEWDLIKRKFPEFDSYAQNLCTTAPVYPSTH